MLPAGAFAAELDSLWQGEVVPWEGLIDHLVRASLVTKRQSSKGIEEAAAEATVTTNNRLSETAYFSTFAHFTQYASAVMDPRDRAVFLERACKHYSAHLERVMSSTQSFAFARHCEANLWECCSAQNKEPASSPEAQCRLSALLAALMYFEHRFEDAIRAAECGLLASAAGAGTAIGRAHNLKARGMVHNQRGHYEKAKSDFGEAMVIYREHKDRLGEVTKNP